MAKKVLSTYDEEMRDPAFKKLFAEKYKTFLLEETAVALIENDQASVRKLTAEVGLTSTVLQDKN